MCSEGEWTEVGDEDVGGGTKGCEAAIKKNRADGDDGNKMEEEQKMNHEETMIKGMNKED
jgi:hypothetical protein